MTFALPAALLLALLALPILGLYILKVRMRQLPVSTNLFWKQLYDEKPPRSIWQHLRHIVSLLAQLLMLALLVLAIADPYLPWQLLQARRIVLVVDNSASMQATDVSATRLDVAKDRAHELISALRERDQLAIVLAGTSPEVAVGMTGHVPTLRRSVDDIAASDNPTHLSDAIRLGRQLIGDHPHGEVIVLSDGCAEDQGTTGTADDESPVPVRWRIISNRANNVGITQFQARRSMTDAVGYEILVAVMNASSEAVRCRLEVTLDGDPVDVIPLNLQAGERWSRALEKTSVTGGTLAAALSKVRAPGNGDDSTAGDNGADAEPRADSSDLNRLAADDTAWAVLPSRKTQKVLIVSPGNLFLRKVFEANPLVDLEVRETFPEQWPTDTLTVLHRMIPAKLPAGDLLVIDPESDSEDWTIEGTLENPIITEQDEQSPLMTHIRLDNVIAPEARKLRFTRPATTLAGTVSGDAVYAQIPRESGRCVVLCMNLEQSDLAFRTAFPIMVTNALNWFARESGELRPALATGSLATMEVGDLIGDDAAEVELVAPSGKAVMVSVGRAPPATGPIAGEVAQCTLGPFDESGVWVVREPAVSADAEPPARAAAGDDRAAMQIAVNIASERETDLRAPEGLATTSEPRGWAGPWLHRPIWFYIVIVACVFTAAEWFLYQRRLIA